MIHHIQYIVIYVWASPISLIATMIKYKITHFFCVEKINLIINGSTLKNILNKSMKFFRLKINMVTFYVPNIHSILSVIHKCVKDRPKDIKKGILEHI